MARRWISGHLAACALGGLLVGGAARADSQADAAGESAMRDLCRAVAASPTTLQEAMDLAALPDRVALGGEFTLAGDGGLRLTVLTGALSPDATDFREWTGPVTEECWAPHERRLAAPAEVAAAARRQTLAGLLPYGVAAAGARFAQLRHHDGRAATHVLSLWPERQERRIVYAGSVAVDGLVWSATLGAERHEVTFGPPDFLRERETAAKRWLGKTLPELDVPDGRWVNAADPVRLGSLRGSVVLLVVTDPG